MAVDILRIRNASVLAIKEVTPGTEETPSASVNGVRVQEVAVAPQPNVIESTELVGGLDSGDPVIGATPMEITATCQMRGGGAAGTPPEWGVLAEICGWLRTDVTEIPNGGGDTTIEAGSGTVDSFDVDTNGSDWPATAQAVRGYPVDIQPGGSGPRVVTTIEDYSLSSGTVYTVTVTKTFSGALADGTLVNIPEGVAYTPQSGVIPAATIWVYRDGNRWRLVGARGAMGINLTSGTRGELSFTLRSFFGAKDETAVAVPTGLTTVAPPIWRNSQFSLGRKEAAVQSFTLDDNNTVVSPDNPNAGEGIELAIITGRDVQGTMNPLESLVGNQDIFGDFRASNVRSAAAVVGTAVGNRVACTVPRALYRSVTESDREGLAVNDLPFSALGVDAGAAVLYVF